MITIYNKKNFFVPKEKNKIIDVVLYNQKYFQKELGGYNYPILEDNNNFFNQLYSLYYEFCESKFKFTVHPNNNKTCWAYVSDKLNFAEVWHNHIETSTINGVYYLNIPDKTSIDFECNGEYSNYEPSEFELIVFPNYLNHKPNRCSGDGYRIAINMEIICYESADEIFSKLI
jgi:hypothetical protein